MSVVIDLTFHQATLQVVEELLDRRGLGYFLQKGAGFPYVLCDRRVDVALEIAARRSGREPAPDTRRASRRAVRRRLIALVAEAMVHVGY